MKITIKIIRIITIMKNNSNKNSIFLTLIKKVNKVKIFHKINFQFNNKNKKYNFSNNSKKTHLKT